MKDATNIQISFQNDQNKTKEQINTKIEALQNQLKYLERDNSDNEEPRVENKRRRLEEIAVAPVIKLEELNYHHEVLRVIPIIINGHKTSGR